MRDVQDHWLDRFERIIEDAGRDAAERALVPLQSSAYANVGTVLVHRRTTGAHVLKISYSFQAGYASVHMSGPLIGALGLDDSPPGYRYEGGRVSWHSLKYDDSDRVEAMFDLLRRAVDGV